VYLVLKTTTYSLTDIIEVFSWPKNWTIENKSAHFAFFTLYPYCANFLGKQFSLWLGRHLAAEVSNNAQTGNG
jgi:hypothetical protein